MPLKTKAGEDLVEKNIDILKKKVKGDIKNKHYNPHQMVTSTIIPTKNERGGPAVKIHNRDILKGAMYGGVLDIETLMSEQKPKKGQVPDLLVGKGNCKCGGKMKVNKVMEIVKGRVRGKKKGGAIEINTNPILDAKFSTNDIKNCAKETIMRPRKKGESLLTEGKEFGKCMVKNAKLRAKADKNKQLRIEDKKGGNFWDDLVHGASDVIGLAGHAAQAIAPVAPLLMGAGKKKEKKAPSKWNLHLKSVASKNKGKDFKAIVEIAKKSYKK